jgi:hypothetical protein
VGSFLPEVRGTHPADKGGEKPLSPNPGRVPRNVALYSKGKQDTEVVQQEAPPKCYVTFFTFRFFKFLSLCYAIPSPCYIIRTQTCLLLFCYNEKVLTNGNK